MVCVAFILLISSRINGKHVDRVTFGVSTIYLAGHELSPLLKVQSRLNEDKSLHESFSYPDQTRTIRVTRDLMRELTRSAEQNAKNSHESSR